MASDSPKLSAWHYLAHGVYFLLYAIPKHFPSPVGDLLRWLASAPFTKQLSGTRIYEGVTLWYPYRLSIGKNVSLNEWVYISAIGGVTIGNDVRIGHRTSIITSDHNTEDRDTPFRKQGFSLGTVTIEDDVWIGCNVTILKNVTIGRGAIVAAGAVVTKDVEPFAVVGGAPAKQIGVRGAAQS